MGKSAGSKAGGGGGGGGAGKSISGGSETAATSQTVAASKNGLTPEQEQSLKNYVLKTASGVDKTLLNKVISDGWNGIPNGEIVYVSKLHGGSPRPGETFYRKVDNNTIIDQDGKRRNIDERQKNNMLGTYALQKTTIRF